MVYHSKKEILTLAILLKRGVYQKKQEEKSSTEGRGENNLVRENLLFE